MRGISFGVSLGVRTLSITWIIPLLAITSACMTFASLTITPESTVKDNGWVFCESADIQSVTADDGTLPATT